MNKISLRYGPLRVVLVTLGLALTGAVFGAIAGALGLAVALLLDPSSGLSGSLAYCEFAACVGALLGAVSAPTVTWVMLPSVPLGRLFSCLTAGTIAGGVFGWFAFSSLHVIWGPTLSAFAGFMATAVALGFRYDDARRLSARTFGRLNAE